MNYQDLASKYQTPFYIFDIEKVTDRINYLKSFMKDIELVYSIKANPFIVPFVKDLVDRFELCSPGEYDITKKAGASLDKMVISGVYKDNSTMEKIFNDGIPHRYTIESLNQWNLLKEKTHKYNKNINVILRLTSSNQFGMSKEDIEYILSNQDELITIKGIEYFSKTQRKSITILEKELIELNEYLEYLEETYNYNLEEFEYGPGFPVFYFEGDEFDEETFFTDFFRIIQNIKNKKISLEMGRSLAASCGEYVTKVVDMKSNNGNTYAIVDGGINHIAYYGQTMAMKVPHHEIVPNRDGDDKYCICGSLCTINDIIIKELRASNLSINDLLVFKNTGAYCMTEGISLFLSRNLPSVLIKKSDTIVLARESVETSTLNSTNM